MLGACTARNVEAGEVTGSAISENPVGTAAEAGGSEAFGDLDSPCGSGELSVEGSEAAGSPDVLRIGVPNDRSSTIRPGLNRELWDTAVAFAAWCNEQGGIGGLPIELVDVDGKVLFVEDAMAGACNGAFMLVGGGLVQDNLEFSGKPGSDFHLCGLVDIPAFAASPQKADSNGQVQPLPRSATELPRGSFASVVSVLPEAARMAVLWGQLPTLEAFRNVASATAEAEGIEVVAELPYPITGQADWTPLAEQIIRSGAGSIYWVGEPTNLGSLLGPLRIQGWEGIVMGETNAYDQVFLDSAGADAEGAVVRLAFHSFEESDRWPAVADYQDLMAEYQPEGKVAMLGMQAMSAWLLFATAARECGQAEGVLSRACVLRAAEAVDDWTAGGLHVPTDPGPPGKAISPCGMLLVVRDGGFERLFPEIGGPDDDGDGFACHDELDPVKVPENAGLGVTSPDQPL